MMDPNLPPNLDPAKPKLIKTTFRVFSDDLDYLRLAYPSTGYNAIVRKLVQSHVKKLREAAANRLQFSTLTDKEKEIA